MVTVHCSWWTGFLKLRNALPIKCILTTGISHLAFPWLLSFHGVPWECVGSKFWIQGVALAVLMLFQHCFCYDWIVTGCGLGFIYMWVITLSRIFFLLGASWDFSLTVDMLITCKTCLWYIQLWRNGWWHMTLLFGKFALFYHHQSCQYKFESYINCCLAGCSVKQKSEHAMF